MNIFGSDELIEKLCIYANGYIPTKDNAGFGDTLVNLVKIAKIEAILGMRDDLQTVAEAIRD